MVQVESMELVPIKEINEHMTRMIMMIMIMMIMIMMIMIMMIMIMMIMIMMIMINHDNYYDDNYDSNNDNSDNYVCKSHLTYDVRVHFVPVERSQRGTVFLVPTIVH